MRQESKEGGNHTFPVPPLIKSWEFSVGQHNSQLVSESTKMGFLSRPKLHTLCGSTSQHGTVAIQAIGSDSSAVKHRLYNHRGDSHAKRLQRWRS